MNGAESLVRHAAQMLVQNHDSILRGYRYQSDYREGLEWGERRAAVFVLKYYCRDCGPKARKLVRREVRFWIQNFKRNTGVLGKGGAA